MKVWNGYTPFRFAHVKRDGWSVLVKKALGKVTCYSSNFNELDLSWHPSMTSLLTRVPDGTELYCELWKPGEKSAYIPSGIKHQDKSMRLDVYAVTGERSSPLTPRAPLQQVADQATRWGLDFIEWYVRCNVEDLPPISKHCLGGFLHVQDLPIDLTNMEGFVLKDGNMMEPYKYKPFLDCTLKVVGVRPGKGKYTGMIGSLVCALKNGTEVINLSGMSDALREEITNNAAKDMGALYGRLVEVKYQYVNTQGRLRHASFVRWRDDKKHADVKLSSKPQPGVEVND